MIQQRLIVILIIVALLISPLSSRAQTVDLVTDPLFNPNDIISDADLTDTQAMTVEEIQAFLVGKGGALAQYREFLPQLGEARSAAWVIWQAAQDAHLNPEILLTMLQKEQSLIEDPSPTDYQYQWAMGYSKCDGCAGIDAYKGFGNQVRAAATRLRYYFDHPSEFPRFTVGQSTTTSDGFTITPASQGTAGLYIYNPWRGGARVDDRLIGANYNFYKIWKRYFAPSFVERTLVKERDTNAWWLIQENTRRPFVAEEVVAALFDQNVRSAAPVVPVRTLTRYYPVGTLVTFDEVYAGVFAGSAFAEQLFAGQIAEGAIKYKNVGSRIWKRGEVVLTVADVAGAPTELRIQDTTLAATASTTPKKGRTKPTPKPSIDLKHLWRDTYGRFDFTEAEVPPGSIATFPLSLRFPSQPKGFDLALRLKTTALAEGATERNVSGTLRSLIVVGEPLYQGRVMANTIPTTMKPLQTASVEIEVKNTGAVPWKRLGLRLSSMDETKKKPNPFYHVSWRDRNRVVFMKEQVVEPGGSAHFAFKIRAPRIAGEYKTLYRLSLFDSTHKLNDQTVLINGEPAIAVVTIVAKDVKTQGAKGRTQGEWSIKLIEFGIPDVMRPGDTQEVLLRFENTGSKPFIGRTLRLSSYAGDGKSPNPFRDQGWRDEIRVAFLKEDSVAQGSAGTFIFDITAPNKKQFYRTQYRLTIHDREKGIDGVPVLINDGKEVIIATTTVK